MANNIFSFINKKSNDKKLLLKTLNYITNSYNKILYKYTKSYAGRIAVPKTETADIPKNFISVQEYINSKTAWKIILKFINSTESSLDVNDYIDTMIRNWQNITIMLCNEKLKKPTINILFSPKMIKTYNNFKNDEQRSAILNKSINIKRSEDFYLLAPSLQSNINSLFSLKNINPDLTYKEIVNIFAGEFEPKFKTIINNLEENEINQETIVKYL